MRKNIVICVVILFLFGCSSYKWEEVTSDVEESVNVLAIISLEDTLNSFVRVHHTLQPGEDNKIIVGYDTVYYGDGQYDYYVQTVKKLNYEYDSAEVMISSVDGDYQFYPISYKIDEEYKSSTATYQVIEEIQFEDTTGAFVPQAGLTYYLKITTPDDKVITGETQMPDYPIIDTSVLPDTLFNHGELTVTVEGSNKYKKFITFPEDCFAHEVLLTENENSYTWGNYYNYQVTNGNTLPFIVKVITYDKNYSDYFFIEYDGEVISQMLGESDDGLTSGIENGMGVFGSLISSQVQIFFK